MSEMKFFLKFNKFKIQSVVWTHTADDAKAKHVPQVQESETK